MVYTWDLKTSKPLAVAASSSCLQLWCHAPVVRRSSDNTLITSVELRLHTTCAAQLPVHRLRLRRHGVHCTQYLGCSSIRGSIQGGTSAPTGLGSSHRCYAASTYGIVPGITCSTSRSSGVAAVFWVPPVALISLPSYFGTPIRGARAPCAALLGEALDGSALLCSQELRLKHGRCGGARRPAAMAAGGTTEWGHASRANYRPGESQLLGRRKCLQHAWTIS